MNTVRCSNCGAENAADLKFCTNCGKPLATSNSGQTPPVSNSVVPPAKSKRGRNTIIFGGLGCAVLLVSVIALCGILGYIGRNPNTANLASDDSTSRTNSNSRSNSANRSPIKISNSNSVVFGSNNSSSASNDNDSNSSDDNSNSDDSNENSSSPPPTDEEFRNFLRPQIGEYERQGEALDGNVTEDYPGADKITKADYLKKKKINVVMAQFASPATAKQSYGYFFDGFKAAGAKVLTRQKVKNKSGVETGNLAIYVHKNKWETLVYADRFGFRITAPDRATLVDFLQAFSTYTDLMSDK